MDTSNTCGSEVVLAAPSMNVNQRQQFPRITGRCVRTQVEETRPEALAEN
jgi:hypothetical protein